MKLSASKCSALQDAATIFLIAWTSSNLLIPLLHLVSAIRHGAFCWFELIIAKMKDVILACIISQYQNIWILSWHIFCNVWVCQLFMVPPHKYEHNVLLYEGCRFSCAGWRWAGMSFEKWWSIICFIWVVPGCTYYSIVIKYVFRSFHNRWMLAPVSCIMLKMCGQK